MNAFSPKERRLFLAADPSLVQKLELAYSRKKVVAVDLNRCFSLGMKALDQCALHSEANLVVQTDSRGKPRFSDFLALQLRQLLCSQRSEREEDYLFAVAMGRCLPLYFLARLYNSRHESEVRNSEFFMDLTRTIELTAKIYRRPYKLILTRGAKHPTVFFRDLVIATCEFYSRLYDLKVKDKSKSLNQFIDQNVFAPFILHFPLGLDLHFAFIRSRSVRRKPHLDFYGIISEDLRMNHLSELFGGDKQ